MKRFKLVLGLVAVMAAMIVALAAPAMAKDNDGKGKNDRHLNGNNGNNGGNNHFDNRLDRIDNHHDNWFDNDRDNIVIRYVSDSNFDSDDFDSFYPYWGWGFYPYWGSYDDCGFDWDGPVTPADCWD